MLPTTGNINGPTFSSPVTIDGATNACNYTFAFDFNTVTFFIDSLKFLSGTTACIEVNACGRFYLDSCWLVGNAASASEGGFQINATTAQVQYNIFDNFVGVNAKGMAPETGCMMYAVYNYGGLDANTFLGVGTGTGNCTYGIRGAGAGITFAEGANPTGTTANQFVVNRHQIYNSATIHP